MATMGMAIDLRRCAGCYACVVACQMHNNTKPGVAWGHVDAKEWGEDPDNRRCYLPHACMHCEDAPCVKVCPTGASYVREDDIVMVDYDQCINCGSCLHACPFGARVQNDVEGNFFDTAEQAPYEAEGIQRTQVVEKCIFCAGRVDAGLQPACVQNCPGNARVFGDLDDPESPISAFLAKDGVVRVGNTHFCYRPVDGMPKDLLPHAEVQAVANKGVDSKPAEAGIPLPAAIGAVAVAAAAGAGIGIGVKNAKGAKNAAPTADNHQTAKGGDDHE
ncbi:4Fe-4S dicluster domain-containing protein [Eggerthella sinensis]|uniref:4Fe-4S ferredoxin n=1 Tax=Eggerthella sinensis TaxID=242230 RepID=A0A3N0IX70_9ACTN|nr:4Fe-4S dicluster domain-containing protein [Eggerthella sinensis]RDB67546.1 4Fe-4S ferredoxin [Eggerthella sinensis]RNM41527.1 4Fe-4S ferredoxin [Eggerthella sinensis]